jgi:osmotically-inducible protein OsmY
VYRQISLARTYDIIVKSGRTTLVGAVDSASDRQLAELRARREVTGVFEVENDLIVAQ